MRQTIRIFLILEAATFVVASLIHSGVLVVGYGHHEARVAECVIAVVLVGALASTWIWPAWTRPAGFAAQAFALLGTLVGVFFIAVGLGPRTIADIVYHLAIVAVLVFGLVIAKRAPARGAKSQLNQ